MATRAFGSAPSAVHRHCARGRQEACTRNHARQCTRSCTGDWDGTHRADWEEPPCLRTAATATSVKPASKCLAPTVHPASRNQQCTPQAAPASQRTRKPSRSQQCTPQAATHSQCTLRRASICCPVHPASARCCCRTCVRAAVRLTTRRRPRLQRTRPQMAPARRGRPDWCTRTCSRACPAAQRTCAHAPCCRCRHSAI